MSTSRYSNLNSQFGNISRQGQVTIQCSQNKTDIVERMRIAKDLSNRKKDYYVHSSEPRVDASCVRIDRGDPVFMVGTSQAPRGAVNNNQAPQVTSYLNALSVRKQNGQSLGVSPSEKDINLKLAEGIRFIGVALGATNPNPEEGDGTTNKSQLTVGVQGTYTMFNNGSANIVPGETILWQIPTKEEVEANQKKRYGRNDGKILLQLVPLRKADFDFSSSIKDLFKVSGPVDYRKNMLTVRDDFAYEIKKLMTLGMFMGMRAVDSNLTSLKFNDVWNLLGKDAGQTVDALQGVSEVTSTARIIHGILKYIASDPYLSNLVDVSVSAYLKIHHDIERRKMGRSLTFSKPGQPVDILLGV